MDFSEYVFVRDMIAEDRARTIRDQMTAASFTAWQIHCSNGGKKSWKKYAEEMGLLEKKTVSRSEREAAIKTALEIQERLNGRT